MGDELLNHLIAQCLNKAFLIRDVRQRGGRGIGYAGVARAAAEMVRDGLAWRGVLICGTGIGVSIAANRVRGVRAAACHDLYSVQRSVLSNDCQILCLGSRVIAAESAVLLLDEWIKVEFDPESKSALKVAEIDDWERTDEEWRDRVSGSPPG